MAFDWLSRDINSGKTGETASIRRHFLNEEFYNEIEISTSINEITNNENNMVFKVNINYYRVSQKSTPPPLFTGNRNDKILLLSEWTAKFINLQFRFTYISFKNGPLNTGDTSLQSQNLQCTRNKRF